MRINSNNMENLDDIKQVWLSTPNTLPAAKVMITMIKRHRYRQTLKITGLILLTIFLMAVMCWVLVDYKSRLMVTRIGEGFFFIALLIILGAKTRSLIRIANWKNYSNEDYIHFLKQEQTRQIEFQKTTKVIGFSIASLGLMLYIFEMVHSNTTVMIISYILVLLWIAGCWFIVRPLAIKRSNRKLAETIEKLERLTTQLTND